MKAKDLYPAVFSRHAGEYARRLEEIMARGEARGRTLALELAAVGPGMRVLDIACGPGTLTRRLAGLVEPGGEVVGVDLAPGMIELARTSAPANARFEVMDMERLEFVEASFDAALCGHGLQFATDLGAALREARRVLKAGSRLAASVPMTPVKEDVWALVDEVVDRWLPPPPSIVDNAATRASVRDPQAMGRAVGDAGFTGVRIEEVVEEVLWPSAEQLVGRLMGWWDFAYRIEGMDEVARDAMAREAIAALRRRHPGPITTRGLTLVLVASA